MNRIGHIGISLLLASPFAFLFGVFIAPHWTVITFGAAFITGHVPDIDQRLPLNHRGFTHTVLFAALVSGVLSGIVTIVLSLRRNTSVIDVGVLHALLGNIGVLTLVFLGFMLGFIGHLVGDILTEAYDYTVTPFWPFSNQEYVLGWTTADSKIWNWGLLVLGIVSGIGAIVALNALA